MPVFIRRLFSLISLPIPHCSASKDGVLVSHYFVASLFLTIRLFSVLTLNSFWFLYKLVGITFIFFRMCEEAVT